MVTIRGLFRTQISKMIFFFKDLKAFSKKLNLRCLKGSEYASDTEAENTVILKLQETSKKQN